MRLKSAKSVTLARLDFYPKDRGKVSQVKGNLPASRRIMSREQALLLIPRAAFCLLLVGAFDVSISVSAPDGLEHFEKNERIGSDPLSAAASHDIGVSTERCPQSVAPVVIRVPDHAPFSQSARGQFQRQIWTKEAVDRVGASLGVLRTSK
jgi:hypothetical protein